MNAKLGIGIVIAVLAIVAIGMSFQGNVPTGQVALASSEETIKIGLVAPLTGELASWGQNALAGVSLAVEEENQKGGINGRKIELIVEDDRCTSDSVSAVQKLVNVDNVLGLLGPICSSAAGPAMPVAQENGVPTIMITASAPHLTAIGNNIFRVFPSDKFQGKVGAEFVYNELEKRNVAIIYVENDWGQGLRNVFKERFTQLGGNIVYESNVLPEETAFSTEIVKVKESGAEALYFPVYPKNGVAGFKQITEMGLEIPVVGGDSFNGEEVVKSGFGDGIIFTVPKVSWSNSIEKEIKSQAGFENLQVAMPAPLGYDSAKIMIAAIEKAGLDREKIRKAIAETSYAGASNPLIEFDEIGDLKTAVFEIKIIEDGKAVEYRG